MVVVEEKENLAWESNSISTSLSVLISSGFFEHHFGKLSPASKGKKCQIISGFFAQGVETCVQKKFENIEIPNRTGIRGKITTHITICLWLEAKQLIYILIHGKYSLTYIEINWRGRLLYTYDICTAFQNHIPHTKSKQRPKDEVAFSILHLSLFCITYWALAMGQPLCGNSVGTT